MVLNSGLLAIGVSVKELATAVSMKMDLTVLILNDNAYGMIKWKQVTSHACPGQSPKTPCKIAFPCAACLAMPRQRLRQLVQLQFF